MVTNPARYASKVVSTRAALVRLRRSREWAIDSGCVKPSLLVYLAPSPVALTPGMQALSEKQRLGYGYFEGTFTGRFDVADVALRPLGAPLLFGREKLTTRFVLIDVVDPEFVIVPKR